MLGRPLRAPSWLGQRALRRQRVPGGTPEDELITDDGLDDLVTDDDDDLIVDEGSGS